MVNVVINGVTYSYPQTGDQSWGDNATNAFVALAGSTLQKSGGNFTLTADVNFGGSFGLLSQYFTTRTATPSTAGVFRLAKTDSIGWRNNANNANLLLAIDGSDNLLYNGSTVLLASGGALSPTQGGTGLTTYTLGDTIYASATNTLAKLAGNTTSTRKFLRQTGTGSVSAAPAWDTLVAGDIPSLDASKITTGQLTTARGGTGQDLSGSSGALIVTGGTVSAGTLGIGNGGTGQTTQTAAFDALSPATTKGDGIAYNGTHNVREAVGANGQTLVADSTASTGRSWNTPAMLRNLCINSGPDIWQLGTSTIVGPATSTYVCDQWYLKTAGASPFAVTGSQVTGTFGAFALKAQVSTASNGSGNAFEMTTVLENRDMLQIYNQNASFSCQIKAFNNVTQVGLQFLTATSEVKPTTTVGSEVLVTVNTGGYTLCSINGQAMGTGATTAGVIGVRIRPTAVSSGNIWDLNNGFQMEQAVINVGPVPIPYVRAGATIVDEELLCQRFYCKTFPVSTAPAQNIGTAGALGMFGAVANQAFAVNWRFPVEMRASPSVTTYSTNAASANWSTNTTTPTAATTAGSTTGIVVEGTTSVTAAAFYTIHASADARI